MITTLHKLIYSHDNHIQNYGFITDLIGKTIYGIDKNIINQYKDIDKNQNLKEISGCPSDCPLEYWLKIIGDFFSEWEGGQKTWKLLHENTYLKNENKQLKNKLANNKEEIK